MGCGKKGAKRWPARRGMAGAADGVKPSTVSNFHGANGESGGSDPGARNLSTPFTHEAVNRLTLLTV